MNRQLARYDMAYDVGSRIVSIDSSVDEVSLFSYDHAGQLTSARNTFEFDESYAFDDGGNRISKNGKTITNEVGNRLLDDGVYTYAYDDENNRTRRTEKGTGAYQTYVWDHRNRLAEVHFFTAQNVEVKAVKYVYDPFDRKVAELVDGTTPLNFANASAKYFVYDGDDVVLDLYDSNVGDGTPA